jgi:predicted MFS family arabinose efflux permease
VFESNDLGVAAAAESALKSPEKFSRVDQRALLAVAVQFFLNGAVFASFMPRLPEIRGRIGVSTATLGALLSIAGSIGIVGSFMVAPAIRRFGTRSVVMLGGFILGGSLPLIGLATGTPLFLIGLVLMMTFDVFVDVAMNMQASWLSARRHAPVMNRLHGLWSLGTVVGGAAASRIAEVGISLRSHLFVASALMLAALFAVGQQLLRVDEHPESEPSMAGSADSADSADSVDVRRPSRRGLSPALVMFALTGLFAVVIEMTSMNWAPFRFTDDFGTTVGFAGLGYVAMTGGMTIGRLSGDWLLVRLGADRLFSYAIASTVFGLVIANLMNSMYTNLIGFGFVGLGVSTLLPRLYDLAAKHRDRPGAGLAALTAGIRVALVASPFLVGTLANSTMSVGGAIAVVSLPAVLGFFVVASLIHRGNR